MPLIQGKGPQAFSKNVGREMDAGKPQNQALAIAYAVRRKNARKMAKGGMVDGYADGGDIPEDNTDAGDMNKTPNVASLPPVTNSYNQQKSGGGGGGGGMMGGLMKMLPLLAAASEGGEADEIPKVMIFSPSSMAKSIRAKGMAAGGEVDDDFLSDEENTELPDEAEDSEVPEIKRKRLLSAAFEAVRQRQTGSK